MFFRKEDEIHRLKERVRELEGNERSQAYTLNSLRIDRDMYLSMYNELERTRPRTLEEELQEARKLNKELEDKRTLVYLKEKNKKLMEAK